MASKTRTVPAVNTPKVLIHLTAYETHLIKKMATYAELGGTSHIRTHNRTQTLAQDQLTAQLGEAALSKFLTGNIALYLETRFEKNTDRWRGDSGQDLKGYPIDIKTSRARRGPNFQYHLWIRDAEYHPTSIYILALVPENENSPIHLVGWLPGEKIQRRKGNRWEASTHQLFPINTLPPKLSLP